MLDHRGQLRDDLLREGVERLGAVDRHDAHRTVAPAIFESAIGVSSSIGWVGHRR